MAKMNLVRADLVARIKIARDEALDKANDCMSLTSKSERYESLRAISAVATYNEVLSMIEWGGTEQQIPAMAAEALEDFEYAHNDDPLATERTLAVTDGRRDALATVTGWMNTKGQLMNRIFLILAWVTVGIWVAATVRAALSPDAGLTPIALAITVALVAIAYKITQYYEKKSR